MPKNYVPKNKNNISEENQPPILCKIVPFNNCIKHSNPKTLNGIAVENQLLKSGEQYLRLTHRNQIPTNEIIYLESEINYTKIYTSDNQRHISSFTLKKLESRIIQSNFLRINRGCLVNLKHITEISGFKRNAHAKLTNGLILQISRRKFDTIANILPERILTSKKPI